MWRKDFATRVHEVAAYPVSIMIYRVKRPLFKLAAAVPLVLTVAVAALWVRSYWRADNVVVWDTQRSSYSLVSVRGHMIAVSQPASPSSGSWFGSSVIEKGPVFGRFSLQRIGARTMLLIPYWALMSSLAAAFALILLWGTRKRRALRLPGFTVDSSVENVSQPAK
jgi:hypothetical protein